MPRINNATDLLLYKRYHCPHDEQSGLYFKGQLSLAASDPFLFLAMKNAIQVPGAFLGKSGKLYVRVRKVLAEGDDLYTMQTAIYPSIDSYNDRSAGPHYDNPANVAEDYLSAVTIDMTTLKIAVDD